MDNCGQARALEWRITPPQTVAEWDAYFALRHAILRAPHGAPLGSERDEHDASESGVLHAAAWTIHGSLIGCGRIHPLADPCWQIRYMAVLPAWRGRGVGGALLRYLEFRAAQAGAKRVVLQARVAAEAFYRCRGYRRVGPGPVLFGSVCHWTMERVLTSEQDHPEETQQN